LDSWKVTVVLVIEIVTRKIASSWSETKIREKWKKTKTQRSWFKTKDGSCIIVQKNTKRAKRKGFKWF
jgi:hypothetical protein